MIDNPDPKKYRIKKLRSGSFVLVDRQIERWRKLHKKPIEFMHRPVLGRPKGKTKLKKWKLFE